MAPNRTEDPILTEWQAELHHAIEAGASPQVALGYSAGVLPALVGLDALRRLIDQRRDVTAPLVTAGGPSGAWLSALAQPQNGTPLHSPGTITLYTGADPGTHLASGGTLPLPPTGVPARNDRGLPHGFAERAAPALAPAAPFAWELLPLRVLEPPRMESSVPGRAGGAGAGFSGGNAGGNTTGNSTGFAVGLPAPDALAGWLALLLVMLLVIGSLVL
jgi:hypothetical protein